MNALNIFLTTAGFIITMLGIGLAIIRGAEWRVKSNGSDGRKSHSTWARTGLTD